MGSIVDTHCHLYLEEFDSDRDKVVAEAQTAGVSAILMPNVDVETIAPLLNVADTYPDYCFPMMGLHPTSVDKDYKKSLDKIKKELETRSYVAIGEIGLDLYWDKTRYKEQVDAFQIQMQWACELNLPVSVHVRDAFEEIRSVFDRYGLKERCGVFHCFSGSMEDARWVVEQTSFDFGITGNVTYKNSQLPEILLAIPMGKLLIETDSPYLSPVPYRGKRNHPAHLTEVVKRLAHCYQTDEETIKTNTETNARRLFMREREAK